MKLFFQKHTKKISLFFLALSIFIAGAVTATFLPFNFDLPLASPFSNVAPKTKELPFLQYTIPHLQNRRYAPDSITLEQKTAENVDFVTFLFSYSSGGKKITGQLNLPQSALKKSTPAPVIVLLRGYVPVETYETGVGTKNAANVFARNGYITIAPDFLGYGQSDPEPENTWEARFIKPIQVIELISSIRSQKTLNFATLNQQYTAIMDSGKMGIWAHSNGGQIALTTLEIMQESIPTTLWAPVSVPFPYSVLFYTDEMDDEGKATRLWVSEFEKDYNSKEFSLTQYLDSLKGPIQLHHGTNDDAALKTWSDEFKGKVDAVNVKRKQNNKEIIELTYHIYQGTDHNMVPNWDTVIQRDLQFFARTLDI